jgi:hypothetical protein
LIVQIAMQNSKRGQFPSPSSGNTFEIRTARQSNPLQALIVAQDGGVNASREA